jgi:hypothetical protein
MYYLQELSDYDRDTLLIPARFWLRNVSSRQAHRIIDAFTGAFETYKESVTDSRGFVRVENRINLLSLSTQKKTRRVRAESLHPSQCAGPAVTNRIDLAFKLWLDGFPTFKSVLDEFGLLRTLAVIGVVARNEAGLESLLRLNNLLAEQLSDTAVEAIRTASEYNEKDRARGTESAKRAKKLQEISAIRRGEKKAEATEKMRKAAIDYQKSFPLKSADEVAAFVSKNVFSSKYSPKTVKARIKGTKRLALEALSAAIPRR